MQISCFVDIRNYVLLIYKAYGIYSIEKAFLIQKMEVEVLSSSIKDDGKFLLDFSK